MQRVTGLADTSVGRKILMASSGLVLFAFVVAHAFGNLKVYSGREHFDAYAEGLRTMGAPVFARGQLLWAARLVLLAAVGVHVWAAWSTTRQSWAARRVPYAKKRDLSTSYASRTMRWGGVMLGAFVAYHLLHLTFGTVHPDFVPGDPYHNFVEGFRRWPASAAYVLAMIPLALHLYHGAVSATQTLGLASPRLERWRRPVAATVAIAVGAVNVSFPLAVLAGVVR